VRKMQKQVVQVEFNDPIENDTTNLNIIESEEKIVESRADHEEMIKSMLKKAIRTHLMLVESYYIK
jgi:hypothetical protein